MLAAVENGDPNRAFNIGAGAAEKLGVSVKTTHGLIKSTGSRGFYLPPGRLGRMMGRKGEIYIDVGQDTLQIVSTLAHEVGHVYGFNNPLFRNQVGGNFQSTLLESPAFRPGRKLN